MQKNIQLRKQKGVQRSTMSSSKIQVKQYAFNHKAIESLKHDAFMKNWPIVYILNDDKHVYVGETSNAIMRMNTHLTNDGKKFLKKMNIITDEEFHKSATLHLESLLIEYMSADDHFEKISNSNTGQSHMYFQKDHYAHKFEELWSLLRKKNLVHERIDQIRNKDLFKFSPYKSLTEDQFGTVDIILQDLAQRTSKLEKQTYMIQGEAGTGKTVLAIYIVKLLSDLFEGRLSLEGFASDELENLKIIKKNGKKLKIGLVVPMASLRKTIKNVFKDVNGLKANMVISPSDATRGNFDILVVDEAHRLKRRKNLANGFAYKSFDNINKQMKLSEEGNELDWILKSSKYQILFYDKGQTVRPTDVRHEDFKKIIESDQHLDLWLFSQMRVNGGDKYVTYIKDILHNKKPKKQTFEKYDVCLFNDIDRMINEIKAKNDEIGLCRIVSGYAWDWASKNDHSKVDITIGQYSYIWNTENEDWVNSKNSVNEIGCIHTIQGYDLNYAAVILGEDIKYDPIINKVFVDRDNFFDSKAKNDVKSDSELFSYIINAYTTMLTRGIRGTYLYVCNDELREYLKSFFDVRS